MGRKWPLIIICAFSAITVISLFIGAGLLGYDRPTFVYIKTKRSILAGALVHMFSKRWKSRLTELMRMKKI